MSSRAHAPCSGAFVRKESMQSARLPVVITAYLHSQGCFFYFSCDTMVPSLRLAGTREGVGEGEEAVVVEVEILREVDI